MTSPDGSDPADESDPGLDPAEQESLRELGERLRDDDPHLADHLSGDRRAPHGGGSRWRHRAAFGAAVAGVAVVAAFLLVAVGPGPGVAMVVAVVVLTMVAASPEIRRRGWSGDRDPRADI